MSRCPECGSHGECDNWCGKTPPEMQDEIDELQYEVEQLQEKLVLSKPLYSRRKLEAENKTMREVLEFYSVNGLHNAKTGDLIDINLMREISNNGERARKTLKELGE